MAIRRTNHEVETISYVKKNAAMLDLSEPILVTQNGAPDYVIEACEHKQEREKTLGLGTRLR